MSGHEQRPGDHRAICALSGFKGWASEMVKRADGDYVLRRFVGEETRRHPQEQPYVTRPNEGRVTWSRPEGEDVFLEVNDVTASDL